jgi:membrane protease YdiL (CAAX protease family)
MLTENRWKLDALMRLLVSVFVCILAGSLAVSALNVIRAHGKINFWFFPLTGAALCFLALTLMVIRKPWTPDNFISRLVFLLVCFYAGFFLGAWAQRLAGPSAPSVGQAVIAAISFQGAALFLIWRFLREHEMSWAEAFGFSRHPLNAFLIGIIVACVFVQPGRLLQKVSVEAMTRATKAAPEEQQSVQALRGAVSWVERITLGLVTILLAPVAEEMMFRGILYQGIKQAGFPRVALWGTSLLFAGVHMNLATFLPLLVLSLVLTLLYERTNNLLAPITAHSLFNALNFALFYFSGGFAPPS